MKNKISLIIFLCFASFLKGQTIEHKVINAVGGVLSSANGNKLEQNVGETFSTTLIANNKMLTQGFLQPYIYAPSNIRGDTMVCEGSNTLLSCNIGTGTWSSSNNAVATIDAVSGLVNGISAGNVFIYYRIIINFNVVYLDSIRFKVISSPAPIGNATQTFFNSGTVCNLVATGSNIKWYDAMVGGNLLSSTDNLVNGRTYYASQTIGDCESINRLGVNVSIIQVKFIYLHLFLEGLFNYTSNNSMIEAKEIDWISGLNFPKFGNNIADRVEVDLFNENPPYAPIGVSIGDIDLQTNGLASFHIPTSWSGNYYIRVRSRNHLEVWSAYAVPFNTTTVEYNFTTNALNAYQAPGGIDPQVQVAQDVFALYVGDLDHSLGVDFDDFNLFEPFMTDGTYGFTIADFNGSGLVDLDDFNLFEPMLTFGPFAQYPGMMK